MDKRLLLTTSLLLGLAAFAGAQPAPTRETGTRLQINGRIEDGKIGSGELPDARWIARGNECIEAESPTDQQFFLSDRFGTWNVID